MKLSLNYPLEQIRITQRFGENLNTFYKQMGLLGHNGIDYALVTGTPVYASHDGTVVFAGHDNASGLGIVIKTDEEFDYNGKPTKFKSIYWHLQEGSVLVKVDEKVKAGQQIACGNNTGMSTGSHLHFGIKPIYIGEDNYTLHNIDQNNGYFGAIDPQPFFNGIYPNGKTIDKPIWTGTEPLIYGMDNNTDVSNLQDILRYEGFFNHASTGFYGKLTAEAVKKYQLKYKVAPMWQILALRGRRVGALTLQSLIKNYGKIN